jgi:hypothetical protein
MKIPSNGSQFEKKWYTKDINYLSFNFILKLAFYNLLGLVFLGVLLILLVWTIKPHFFNSSVDKVKTVLLRDHGYGDYGKNITSKSIKKLIANQLYPELNSRIPTLSFDIRFKHWNKITAKRNRAINSGVLVSNSDDFVPAKITVGDKRVNARIRLKGDNIDHLLGKNKWSFRIKIKDDAYLFGLKKFSVQHPLTRNYQNQFIINEIHKKYGLITPKYFYVNVIINGEFIGIMLLEEHFSKEMLERNQRKEGVIIKYDESAFWESLYINNNDLKLRQPSKNPFLHYQNGRLDAFSKSKIKKSKRLKREYGLAISLLRGFNEGTISASEVFDIDLMANYLAVSKIFYTGHDVTWTNQRFYLNPYTLRLEPIPFDSALGAKLEITGEQIARDILKDRVIYEKYINKLDELKHDFNDGKIVAELQQLEGKQLDILGEEFYFLDKFNFDMVGECSELDNVKYPLYLYGSMVLSKGHPTLELSNPLCEDVEVLSIKWKNSRGDETTFITEKEIDFPLVLKKTRIGELPKIVQVPYEKDPALLGYQLEIVAKAVSKKPIMVHFVKEYFESLSRNPMPENSLDSLLSQHKFIVLGKMDNKHLSIKQGVWDVKGSIIIPNGYKVSIREDTKLKFDSDAAFIIYGTTEFIGTVSKPIVFEPKDEISWNGVAIYNAPTRSKWSNVSINRTKGISYSILNLTGGVTFYNSDVDMDNCYFTGNIGEDALNIVHSDFFLSSVNISDTLSDGFDGDFVKGMIVGGVYKNIGTAGGGGDAIDVSGSNVIVKDLNIQDVNDKAISVGEKSTVEIKNVVIADADIAIASKDGSDVKAVDIKLDSIRNTALMVYNKKPEYGAAILVANNTMISNSLRPAQVEDGSVLILNGKTIKTGNIDVKSMYNKIRASGDEQ